MKKIKLLLIASYIGLGLGIAQPPPPHPGGSGNQGAAVPYILLSVIGMAVLGTKKINEYK
jgi:hypothetical protein